MFANNSDLASFKWDVNELDTDQLKNGPSVLDSFKSKLNGDKMKPVPAEKVMQSISRVNMVRSVTQISRPFLWHLILKTYQIWWLLALGVSPKSLENFFKFHLGCEAFAG